MTNDIVIPKLTCKRCGHVWIPRQNPVYVCPSCHSYKWNIDKEPENNNGNGSDTHDQEN